MAPRTVPGHPLVHASALYPRPVVSWRRKARCVAVGGGAATAAPGADPSATEQLLVELKGAVRAAGAPPGGLNVVAYSGGVDSSLAAYLVSAVFPDDSAAVIGVSASVSAHQLQQARQVAAAIGLRLVEVPTQETSVAKYVENSGGACFFCKSTLYSTLQAVSNHVGGALSSERQRSAGVVLFNGTNADDLRDPTRLGLVAASQFAVVSPLCTLSKARVREVARHVGLPNWDWAASPCLRSRLEYHVPATPELLQQVERAEDAARVLLRLAPQDNMRVRRLLDGTAAVELDPRRLDQAQQPDAAAAAATEELRQRLLALGFDNVVLRPFQSGSLSLAAAGPAGGSPQAPATSGAASGVSSTRAEDYYSSITMPVSKPASSGREMRSGVARALVDQLTPPALDSVP